MPVPESYDDSGVTINVEPEMIFQSATVAIPSLGREIADSVNRISQVWSDLKLGWVGNTAQAAQDFNDRWVSSINELFGSKDGSTTGVLASIAKGVEMAGSNYGQAEDVVTNMFNQTASSLGQGSGSDTPADPHRAVDGPVSENTPSMPHTGRVSPLPPSEAPNPFDLSPPPDDSKSVNGPPPAPNPFDFKPKDSGAAPAADPDKPIWGLG